MELYESELRRTASAMVAPGKGLLAADESTGTIGKRLAAIGVENTRENRVAYRELLFTSQGLGDYISGVIMYDETFRDVAADGTTKLTELLTKQGIIPGIKVDKGVVPQCLGEPGETITEGLDGLSSRCADYYANGARFAKWRAVFRITAYLPSDNNVVEQCHALARYAAICQTHGLVPIVEPEILMEGDHTQSRCQDVTESVLRELFHALARQRVLLEGLILKPNMVCAGADFEGIRPSAHLVAQSTVTALSRVVPAAVPGIMFLSGGQTEEEATNHLQRMQSCRPKPWVLSFSYGRALQQSCLLAWEGKPTQRQAAQAALLARAKANSQAQRGHA